MNESSVTTRTHNNLVSFAGFAQNITMSDNNNSSASPSSSSTQLQRPSLLRGLNVNEILENVAQNGSSGKTPWTVTDGSLRPIPPFYPPLDPRCSTVVVDATPSVVAVRIAESLQKRSVAVEYDDETITACCMTVDRVHFCINLYRGGPPTATDNPDFSHAVIVECVRTRGDPMSFHWACRAILGAAMGFSNGQDERKPIRTSPSEFPRLKRVCTDENILEPAKKKQKSSSSSPLLAMEHAMSLLKKDRLGAQRLGMESLVMLTDERSSGVDTAVYCALAILGSKSNLMLVHNWIKTLIQDGQLPSEMEDYESSAAAMDTTSRSCVRSPTHHLADTSRLSASDASSRPALQEDEHHGGILRALALRALTNSLLVLSREKPDLLATAPISQDLMEALALDLQGATRSPFAVTGTRLASPHEAALAAACLGVLAQHFKSTLLQLQPSVVDALEKAQTARHDALKKEADCALDALSGDVICK